MLASTLCYGGLLATLVGLLSVVQPLRFLHIHSRRVGAVVAALGMAVAATTVLLPTPLVRAVPAGSPPSALDEFMPAYQFSEFHTVHVPASPERVYAAVKQVRPGEIRLLLLLTGIRSLKPGRVLGRGVPPVAAQRPVLEISEQGGFILLADAPGREIVQGTCSQFWRLRRGGRCPGVSSPESLRAFAEPGYAKALINFRIVPEGDGSRLTTETRILATDESARRTFAVYWRLIYPGSALIRRGWLAAIARRATAVEGGNASGATRSRDGGASGRPG